MVIPKEIGSREIDYKGDHEAFFVSFPTKINIKEVRDVRRTLWIVVTFVILVSLNPVQTCFAVSITSVTDNNLNPIMGGAYGDHVRVFGDGVTAGVALNLYWDFVQAWNGSSGFLKSGSAKPDGTFELQFFVPQAFVGSHYLWIKDTDSGFTDKVSFIVNAKILINPEIGMKNDLVFLKGYGFGSMVNVNTIRFGGYALPTNPSIPVTNGMGSWEAAFNVPDKVDGQYLVEAQDQIGTTASAVFKIGPSISLDFKEGPVGKVVEVSGRGFTGYGTVTFVSLGGIDCGVLNAGDLNIDGDGKFKFKLVVPGVGQADKSYKLEVEDSGGKNSTSNFLVKGLPKVELYPQFGSPGSSITIQGWNFAAVAGSDVVITLGGSMVVTLKTNSNGEFSGSFIVPAITSGTHNVEAKQDNFNIEISKPFRVGTLFVILTPKTGPTGIKVSLTGTGFTAGVEWNASFGNVTLFEGKYVSGDTTIYETFYVPSVDPGEYEVTVTEVSEGIEVKTVFTVIDRNSISLTPTAAPVGYNVSIEGIYFSESSGEIEVEFFVNNSTGTWEMDVYSNGGTVTTGKKGNFSAWWVVPNYLKQGKYIINATDEKGLEALSEFSVTPKFITISAYKSTYKRGDTVRFRIESSFKETGSYITIFDANGKFVWKTDGLDTWIKEEYTYVVPFYTQTAGGNPLTLDNEAPLGSWTWTWYDRYDNELGAGSFLVIETTEPDNGGPEPDVSEILDELEALQDELFKFKQDLDVVRSSFDQLELETTNSIDNLEASAEDAMDEAVEAKKEATEAKGDAQVAKDIAQQAKDEADKAVESTKNLSTMFYIAFGISLAALLMGFVGPIRISRKPTA